MWLTVSELVKCPSLPSSERGCRKALDKSKHEGEYPNAFDWGCKWRYYKEFELLGIIKNFDR
ncbi:hypothetical protein ACMXY9_10590 [Pasteurella multocida]|uniref:hypothetical protein n=1 Tax=Pasteurella multocida TaxID=747 RepID=UPI003CF401B3